MSIASWIYDHAPERVRDWMEQRAQDREASEQYEAYLDRQGPSIDQEAASVFGDRRKYNIEHGIPLTPSQQEEQRKVDRIFEREGDDREYAALSQQRTPKETRAAEGAEADEYHDPDRLVADWLKPAAERVELGIETPRPDLSQQQQQTRDYVKEMVDRLEEIEREHPKERRQERGEERER